MQMVLQFALEGWVIVSVAALIALMLIAKYLPALGNRKNAKAGKASRSLLLAVGIACLVGGLIAGAVIMNAWISNIIPHSF